MSKVQTERIRKMESYLDEAGKLPADLKRGVLSEDAVYDLLTEHRDLMARMQRAVLRSMEEKEF